MKQTGTVAKKMQFAGVIINKSYSKGSSSTRTSSRTRAQTQRKTVPTQISLASATPDPVSIPIPNFSASTQRPSTVEGSAQVWSPAVGRAETIFLENLGRFEDALHSPNKSLTSLRIALAELWGLHTRETGSLAAMTQMIQERGVVISEVISRISVEMTAMQTAALGISESGPSGLQAMEDVEDERNEGEKGENEGHWEQIPVFRLSTL